MSTGLRAELRCWGEQQGCIEQKATRVHGVNILYGSSHFVSVPGHSVVVSVGHFRSSVYAPSWHLVGMHFTRHKSARTVPPQMARQWMRNRELHGVDTRSFENCTGHKWTTPSDACELSKKGRVVSKKLDHNEVTATVIGPDGQSLGDLA